MGKEFRTPQPQWYGLFSKDLPSSQTTSVTFAALLQATSWDLRPLCRAMVLQAEKAAQEPGRWTFPLGLLGRPWFGAWVGDHLFHERVYMSYMCVIVCVIACVLYICIYRIMSEKGVYPQIAISMGTNLTNHFNEKTSPMLLTFCGWITTTYPTATAL